MKKSLFSISPLSLTLFFSIFLLRLSSAICQTIVGGLISTNTEWILSGSPYIVDENILVDTGVTLTIDPNVVVKFDSANALTVRGTMRAIGSDDGFITFTSNQTSPEPGDWSYILFDNESSPYDTLIQSGCIMQYCIVEYSGRIVNNQNFSGQSGAIQSSSAAPFIDHCIVRYNLGSGIYFYNFLNNLHYVEVSNNTIESNTPSGNSNEWAINVFAHAGNVRGNLVQNNGDANLASYSYGGISTSTNANCSGNILINNYLNTSNALCLLGTGKASKNIICSNSCQIDAPTTSIVYLLTGDFTNNIIARNTVQNFVPLILIAENYSYNFKINNIAENNSASQYLITTSMTSPFEYNTLTLNFSEENKNNFTMLGNYPHYFSFNYNNIFNNHAVSGYANYSIAFNSPPFGNDFDASNNWWGTTDADLVDSAIYDYFDDFDFGVINATPFLTLPDTTAPISPPNNFTKTNLGNDIVELDWSANPESDVAGYKIYWDEINCYSFQNVIDVGNVTSYTMSNVDFGSSFAATAYDHLSDGIDDQFDGNESWFSFDQMNSPVGIQSIAPTQANDQFYPNPMSDVSFLSTKNITPPYVVELYDELGNLIRSEVSHDAAFEIHRNHLASGLYFFKLKKENHILSSGKLFLQ